MPAQAPSHPAAFGQWLLVGDTLTCRLPRQTVTVRAPAAVLRATAHWCDGHTSWPQVVDALAQRWPRRQVGAFLGDLVSQGVLVDAHALLPHWMTLGHPPGLFAPVASPQEIESMPRRAWERLGPAPVPAPRPSAQPARALQRVLRARRSVRTFGDAPPRAADLLALLWAAGGVLDATAPQRPMARRTTASAGQAYGLRWLVFVLRPWAAGGDAPALAPGAYEAGFQRSGGCALTPLPAPSRAAGQGQCPGGGSFAWRVLRDPRILRFAGALVVPVAEVAAAARKYGNRAALYAHVEAGQGLQNMQLMAAALGLAGCVRGDVLTQPLLGLMVAADGPLLPMPGYVVGPPPSATQEAQAAGERWLQLTALPGPPTAVAAAAAATHPPDATDPDTRGRFAFAAGPVTAHGVSVHALGRGADAAQAVTKAEAEAWERLGWLRPGPVVTGRRHDIPGAVDPATLVAYSRRQLAQPGFAFKAFSPRRAYLWCEGTDALSGARVHVPADCVHALPGLPPPQRAHALTNANTSGVAAWSDAQTALCCATLELVERDAFLRAWLRRLPPAQVRPDSLPASARLRVAALQSQGLHVAVLRLDVPWAPVFAVFVQDRLRPFTGVTAAAHFDAEAAVLKALDEAEGRAWRVPPGDKPPAMRAAQVRTPQDIDALWRQPRFFRGADFLAQGPQLRAFEAAPGTCASWPQLQAHWAREGRALLAVDITPPGASVHQGRLPLKVVRAFVPGLLPIWFAHGTEPAGLPAFAECTPFPGRGAQRTVPIHPFS